MNRPHDIKLECLRLAVARADDSGDILRLAREFEGYLTENDDLPTATEAIALADRVKRMRKSVGMTQAEFGALVGVTTQAVCQWESGRTSPSLRNMEALSAAISHLQGTH